MRKALIVTAALALAALTACGGGEDSAGGAWAAESADRSAANHSLQDALEASRDDGAGRGDEAHDFCIEQVTGRLKAPATARFATTSTTTEDGPLTFVFEGTVDSENGFGALLRSEWTCAARWETGGWQAVQLSVDQR